MEGLRNISLLLLGPLQLIQIIFHHKILSDLNSWKSKGVKFEEQVECFNNVIFKYPDFLITKVPWMAAAFVPIEHYRFLLQIMTALRTSLILLVKKTYISFAN